MSRTIFCATLFERRLFLVGSDGNANPDVLCIVLFGQK